MKCFFPFAALLAAVLFCAGCVPQRITASPGANGVVLDADTRAPVRDAQVLMLYSKRPGWPDATMPTLDEARTNIRPPIVVSGNMGEFYLPRERIAVLNEPMPEWHAYGTLVIMRDGYQTQMFPMSDINNTDMMARTFLMTPTKEASDK